MLYQRLPNWVLGFHGTDEETVHKILNSKSGEHLTASANDYDWLGGGIYFWENDPERALQFAQERMTWKKITDKKPAVIGAVIDLGLCLNLFDQPALLELESTYDQVAKDFRALGMDLPVNEGKNDDRVLRHLDCLIIQRLHKLRKDSAVPHYQSVRAGFHEGDKLYEGSGFRAKNHIQISVCEPAACIKGYFLPRVGAGAKPTMTFSPGGLMRKRVRIVK